RESPAVAAPRRVPSSSELKHLQRVVESRDLLRFEGGFGSFEGKAGRVTQTGFDELEENLAPPSHRAPHAVTWGQIDRVDVKRSGTAKGAGRGMLVGCGIVVAAGAWAYAINQDAGEDTGAPFLVALGAVPTILVTTVIGGLIGGRHSHWEQV